MRLSGSFPGPKYTTNLGNHWNLSAKLDEKFGNDKATRTSGSVWRCLFAVSQKRVLTGRNTITNCRERVAGEIGDQVFWLDHWLFSSTMIGWHWKEVTNHDVHIPPGVDDCPIEKGALVCSTSRRFLQMTPFNLLWTSQQHQGGKTTI